MPRGAYSTSLTHEDREQRHRQTTRRRLEQEVERLEEVVGRRRVRAKMAKREAERKSNEVIQYHERRLGKAEYNLAEARARLEAGL